MMRLRKAMHKWVALPSRQKRLLLATVLIVSSVRLGLWLLPTATVLRAVSRRVEQQAEQNNTDLALHMAHWVARVSRYVPKASCLTQALALQFLLARYGQGSRLQLGIGRDAHGTWQAHAWVEYSGEVILGEIEGLSRFQVFPDWHQALARLR